MPTTQKQPSAPKREEWAGSAAAWKKRGAPHNITLPSGMRVRARVLGLATLAYLDGLPEDLTNAVFLHAANLEQGGLPAVIGAELHNAQTDPAAAERVAKHISDFGRLTRHVVAEALVDPELTVDDLDHVPEDDLEMLMRIVTGRQAFDAAGVRIGVEPVDAWATFRHEHGCDGGNFGGGAACEACARARSAISTVQLDDTDL